MAAADHDGWGGEDREEREDAQTAERTRSKKPRLYRVLLHNDDYTTMEFVVWVLMSYFSKTEPEATHLMLQVHTKGLGVAGVFTRDVAETKVEQVTGAAREHGMPLLCTMEAES